MMRNPLESAKSYINSGLSVVPVCFKSKTPKNKHWQNLVITLENVHEYFSANETVNIGILNGTPSGNLIDLDLDCEESIKLAPFFLNTTATFGHASKPESHYYYKVTNNLPSTKKFEIKNQDSRNCVILEVRSTGTQTVAPGSVHVSGEEILASNISTPIASIDGDQLLADSKKLAAASLLLKNYPEKGTRQDFALAIAGTLLQNGCSEDDAEKFITALATVNGDEEISKRLATVASTSQALQQGRPVTGFKKLSDFLQNSNQNQKLIEWLNIKVQQVDGAKNKKPEPVGNCPFNDANLPEGYKITEDGVFQEGSNGWIKICGPIVVSAFTFDELGSNHGLKLEFINKISKQYELFILASELNQSSSPVINRLIDSGFEILPGDELKLKRYIGSCKPAKLLRCVNKLGWTQDGGFAFVNTVLTRSGSEEIIYQPEKHSPSVDTIYAQGTLLDWQQNVALPLTDNPVPVFALSFGLAASLLSIKNMDSGGFHFYGLTSKGKTTLLQIVTSLFGNGSDPSANPGKTAIRTWNTTGNGLEAICAAYNNLPLPLDEAGKCNAYDFGKIIYDITGGQGKTALNSDRSLKQSRTWSLHIISSGEVSSRCKIEEKSQAKGGQLIRLIDFREPDSGFFPNTGGTDPSIFVRNLKENTGKYFGTAYPAFVQNLLAWYPSQAELIQAISQQRDFYFNQIMVEHPNLSNEQQRVALRFALTAVAGYLAVEFKILPFLKDQIDDAVMTVFEQWLTELDDLSDNVRAIKQLADFIVTNQSRFFYINGNNSHSDQPHPHRMLGYHKSAASNLGKKFAQEYFLFSPEGFAEACKGFEVKLVCKALAEANLIERDSDQFKVRHNVPVAGSTKSLRLYTIKATILSYENKSVPSEEPNVNNDDFFSNIWGKSPFSS